MEDERNLNDQDAMLDPEDVNSAPAQTSSRAVNKSVGAEQSDADQATLDPNDEVPVPVAMSPAEVDERAQVVEALRGSDRDGTTADRNSDV